MALNVNGFTLPIAQLGPDFLVLERPINHTPCEAVIAMSVDGNESRWRVRLADGIRTDQRKTSISRA